MMRAREIDRPKIREPGESVSPLAFHPEVDGAKGYLPLSRISGNFYETAMMAPEDISQASTSYPDSTLPFLYLVPTSLLPG